MTILSNLFKDSPSSEQAINIMSYWDKNMICRFANNQFIKWFGKTPSELIGTTNLKSLLGTSYQLHLPYVKSVFEGNTAVYNYHMLVFSGEKYEVTATYYPDIDNGFVAGFFLQILIKEPEQLLNAKKNEAHFLGLKNKHQDLNTSNKMPQVAQYLEKNLLTGFPSIEHLANLHHISVSKLMRDFKSVFKTSPFIYYRNLQMEYADQYLHETGCSKKQIALLLGFSNPGNFTSCYNRWKKVRQVKDVKINLHLDTSDHLRLSISQLPLAMAMVDRDMNYLVVSNKWLADFNLSGVNVIQKNFYDFFPDKSSKWVRVEKQCLEGKTECCEMDYFKGSSGKRIWLSWDVRPWRDDDGNIGGLLISTCKTRNTFYEHNQSYFEHQ